jgi:hypothetical protein
VSVSQRQQPRLWLMVLALVSQQRELTALAIGVGIAGGVASAGLPNGSRASAPTSSSAWVAAFGRGLSIATSVIAPTVTQTVSGGTVVTELVNIAIDVRMAVSGLAARSTSALAAMLPSSGVSTTQQVSVKTDSVLGATGTQQALVTAVSLAGSSTVAGVRSKGVAASASATAIGTGTAQASVINISTSTPSPVVPTEIQQTVTVTAQTLIGATPPLPADTFRSPQSTQAHHHDHVAEARHDQNSGGSQSGGDHNRSSGHNSAAQGQPMSAASAVASGNGHGAATARTDALSATAAGSAQISAQATGQGSALSAGAGGHAAGSASAGAHGSTAAAQVSGNPAPGHQASGNQTSGHGVAQTGAATTGSASADAMGAASGNGRAVSGHETHAQSGASAGTGVQASTSNKSP